MEIDIQNNWITLIISYIKYKIISFDKTKAKKLKIKATSYALLNDKLYKCHYLNTLAKY